MNDDLLRKALLERAMGGSADEIVEEYAADQDGKLVLQKRKTTKKYTPPDVGALKILLENDDAPDFSTMTDVELEREKQRLMSLLFNCEK